MGFAKDFPYYLVAIPKCFMLRSGVLSRANDTRQTKKDIQHTHTHSHTSKQWKCELRVMFQDMWQCTFAASCQGWLFRTGLGAIEMNSIYEPNPSLLIGAGQHTGAT